MNESSGAGSSRTTSQGLYYSSEKAGIVLENQPVPWNADSVMIEAILKVSPSNMRRQDYSIRGPGLTNTIAESLRSDSAEGRYRFFFRLPPLRQTTLVELFWKETKLGELSLPFLSLEEFLGGLRVHLPSAMITLGTRSIAAPTFVATQCRGIVATGVLRSPTSLAPIKDLGLKVLFRLDNINYEVPITLLGSQLAGREAMLCAVKPKVSKKSGVCAVTWMVRDRSIATLNLRLITLPAFHKSLRVSDTRFVVENAAGELSLSRDRPSLADIQQVGPGFMLSSSLAGIAGECDLDVYLLSSPSTSAKLLVRQTVLVTEIPMLFAPGLLSVRDLKQVTGFELRQGKKRLSSLFLGVTPSATFNSEGGFTTPEEFTWTGASENELANRLNQLMGD